MTLFKQVALLVSLVFLLLVIVTIIGDFRRSSEFLTGQLQTTAQDMATTLGISISNSDTSSDIASLETLFNSVFDSGYYTRIQLTDSNGDVIHKKEQKLALREVPDWFISLVPLREATGTSQIQQGWMLVGQLSITVHPGFTYASLYQSLKMTILWAIALFLIGMILLWFLLHKLMAPLESIRQQADAIHTNQFIQQKKLPSTPELRRVVEAMNRMIAKVQSIFSAQQNTLSRYQDLLYVDSLTGLGNHKYIVNQLEHSLPEDTTNYASIVMIKLSGVDVLRNRKGYDVADIIICLVADLLNEHCIADADEKCARLSEYEFALLVCIEPDVVTGRIEACFDDFREKVKNGLMIIECH
ncbi:MAG: diguanylate cyclase [Gammaproteobacteria bacterium]|nr:diguanylate cyclase [Gammaproteobacteria bacterium]